jgi:hypothetical protein
LSQPPFDAPAGHRDQIGTERIFWWKRQLVAQQGDESVGVRRYMDLDRHKANLVRRPQPSPVAIGTLFWKHEGNLRLPPIKSKQSSARWAKIHDISMCPAGETATQDNDDPSGRPSGPSAGDKGIRTRLGDLGGHAFSAHRNAGVQELLKDLPGLHPESAGPEDHFSRQTRLQCPLRYESFDRGRSRYRSQ